MFRPTRFLRDWFSRDIPFIQEASKSLHKKRELAFYGSEDGLISPEDAISKEDAKKAVDSGKKVFSACRKILDETVA